MTRINSNIDPSLLLDQHLMAEYRELPMVFAALKRSLRTKSVSDILSSIPPKFTLNGGHVTFFYDKLLFLEDRYRRLVEQLRFRGYNLDSERSMYSSSDYPQEFCGEWTFFKEEDNAVVARRIKEKYMMKPTWYTYYGDKIDEQTFHLLYNPLLKE